MLGFVSASLAFQTTFDSLVTRWCDSYSSHAVPTVTPPCNCRNKANYPLEGICRESSIIYNATLKSNGIARHYYGCSETEFKTRFNCHKQSLVHRRKRNATELSKAVWNAKDAETNPSIECTIAAKTNPYHREQNRATSVLPRNSLFYNPTPSQHSTKDHSFAANAAIKTNSK